MFRVIKYAIHPEKFRVQKTRAAVKRSVTREALSNAAKKVSERVIHSVQFVPFAVREITYIQKHVYNF